MKVGNLRFVLMIVVLILCLFVFICISLDKNEHVMKCNSKKISFAEEEHETELNMYFYFDSDEEEILKAEIEVIEDLKNINIDNTTDQKKYYEANYCDNIYSNSKECIVTLNDDYAVIRIIYEGESISDLSISPLTSRIILREEIEASGTFDCD